MKKLNNYILFIDESGKSKLSDIGDNFLLCGLIIDKDLHAALSSYMISLKEKFGIPPNENIHAFDLFEDEKIKIEGAKKRMPLSKINTFLTRLSHVVQGSEIVCLIVRMDKRPYKKMISTTARRKKVSDRALTNYLKRGGLHGFLYEALTRKLILEFGHFLQEEDAHGEVVAESRRQDDHAVLEAFLSATTTSKYKAQTIYHTWSKFSFKRIHGLTFQNKKGLSFGLEIADLFAWSHFNKHYGKQRLFSSRSKNIRVDARLKRIGKIIEDLCIRKKPEDITLPKLKKVAGDRVSEFTETLQQYKSFSVPSGTPPGIPGEP